MPAASAFEYAVVRVVPEIVREEFINVGVILYCRQRRFLDMRIHLDADRLLALSPAAQVDLLRAELDLMACVCAGGPEAGVIGALSQAERFRWLTSPRNTMVQISPVHVGLCDDPHGTLERLFRELVTTVDDGRASG